MTKLELAISSIKCVLECSDEEAEMFKELTSVLNKKTNELMINTGKISDRLLLFIVILINANKEFKIFNNFEKNITKLLKNISPILRNTSNNLDEQLILASIIEENETLALKEDENSIQCDEKTLKILEENKKNNKETLEFMDELISSIEKLANNINKV